MKKKDEKKDNRNTKTMSLCSDKRDILDLVKLSYIIVRTGIGTGQIQVKHYFTASLSVCCFVKKKRTLNGLADVW